MDRGLIQRTLRYRDFRFLLAGNAISASGDWLYNVALVVYVFEATHSEAWVAASAIVRLLPFVVFTSFGGVIADRYLSRRLLVICDVIRGGLMLLLTIMVVLDAPVVLVLAVTALSSPVSAVYRPALSTLTPLVVRDEDLAAANTVAETVENLALLIGPAAGGLLLTVAPAAAAFGINGATYLLAVVLMSRLSVVPELQADGETEPLGRRLTEGYRTAAKQREIRVLVIVLFGAAFVYGHETVLWVFASVERLGTGSGGVAYLLAAAGVGGVTAAALVPRVAERVPPGRIMLLSAFGLGGPMVLLAFIRNPLLGYAVVLVEGAAVITLDVLLITTLQRVATRSQLPKVFGILDGVGVIGLLVGSTVASAVASGAGLRAALIVGGASFPLLAVLLTPQLRAISERAVARKEELAGRVKLLEGLRILDGASPATVEAVAASMTEQPVRVLDTLAVQGADADDLFIVAEGEFDVSAAPAAGGAERVINHLGPGDYFGEIGVLSSERRRTATVRATADGLAYRISGERFREAVLQLSAVPSTLHAGMSIRLDRSRAVEQ